MKKSKFKEAQIAFAIKQSETGVYFGDTGPVISVILGQLFR
ncbi:MULTISPECIES: hypothetical protein [unclassified Sphingobacterium]|mgnify:CR=1 FL=1|nr:MULTISPECIES: hypothetical protein [unclassified Sphingobacterium]